MEDSKKKGISGIMNILKSSNNRLYKLLLILLSGICLMIVVWPANNSKTDKNDQKSGWTGQSDETDADVTGGNDRNMSGDTTDYVEYMEERLTSVLEQVDGISDVRVMITVKDSGENIALKDSGSSSSENGDSSQRSVSEETVMVSEGSGSAPYVVRDREPETEGVVIICKGVENGDTTLKITNAVQALFDVPTHKIVILEAN